MNSFALAARYGTPASYQHLGEYLQLNYKSYVTGWTCASKTYARRLH